MHEETKTDLLAEAARNDTDGNGVNDLADACRLGAGSDFADANGNGFADGCEADMNRLQAFPGQRNGAGGGGGGGGGGGRHPAGPARDTTAPALVEALGQAVHGDPRQGQEEGQARDAALHGV